MWRYLFVIVLLVLASCAPPKPVSWQPPLKEFFGAQGFASYQIDTPKGRFHGEAFVLAGADFIYFEVPSPFGLTLYQGIVYENHAEIIDFLRKQIYFFEFSFPKEIYSHWGNIFFGFFPYEWSKYATAYREDKGFCLKVSFAGKKQVLAFFSDEGKLTSLEIKCPPAKLKFNYRENSTKLIIPRLRSKADFSYQGLRLLSSKPTMPQLFTPRGFKVLFYAIK